MSDDRKETRLYVKFAWKAQGRLRERKGSEVRGDDTADNSKSLSRSAMYVRQLKANDDLHYEQRLRKDRERKKVAYVKIEDRTLASLGDQRERWRVQKQKQRYLNQTQGNVYSGAIAGLQKPTPKPKSLKTGKPLKSMTASERKEYNKLKKQESRERKPQQARVAERQKNTKQRRESRVSSMSTPSISDGGSVSRASRYRTIQSIKKQLPTDPETFADVLEHLTNSATPRKKTAVQKRFRKGNTCRRNLGSELAVTMRDELRDLRKSGTVKQANRAAYCALVRLCVAGRLTRRTLAACGISHTTSWRAKKRLLQVTRKKRKNALSTDVTDTVTKFWYESAREMPLKKRVKKGKPLYMLDCNYTELFRDFRAAFPQIKIGYVSFIKLRPSNVRMMRPYERIVCCCQKCEVVKLYLLSLNMILPELLRHLRISHVHDISNISLCQYDGMFPSPGCVNRKCKNCGPHLVKEHFLPLVEVRGDDEIAYDTWETVRELREVRDGKGGKIEKVCTRIARVTKNTSVSNVVNLLLMNVDKLSGHLFRAKWQQRQMQILKDHLPAKSALVIIDFAQNYACSLQDEVQSYHWAQEQVTVHPAVAFINHTDQEGQWTKKETVVALTDDKKHDAAAVRCFMMKTYAILKEKYGLHKVYEFSDCCAGQYRGKQSFANISFAHEDFQLEIEHHYFESSHGKSSADGDSAVVKYGVTKAVTNRKAVVRNANEFYEYCTHNLSTVGNSVYQSQAIKYQNSSRSFIFIEPGKIVRNDNRRIDTVKGTMTIHSTKNTGVPYTMESRPLSCFCEFCKNKNGDKCDSLRYVGNWSLVQLKQSKNKLAQVDHEEVFDTPEDESLDEATEMTELTVGNFVAVGLKGRKKQALIMYVGRIEELDENELTARIQFFKKGTNDMCFTVKEGDVSWETVEERMASIRPPKALSRGQYLFDEQSLTIAALLAGATTPVKFN